MNESNRAESYLKRDFARGGGKELDFSRYLHLLLRNIWLVGFITAIALGAMWLWLMRQSPQYASKAVVQLETGQPRVLGKVEDVQPQILTADDYLNTVAQSFGSETLMLRVARATGLDKDPKVFPPLPDGKSYSDAAIAGTMRNRISAELRRNTRLIDITVLDVEPARANKIADAVIREFVQQTVEQKYNLSRMATEFLQEEGNKLKAKLEADERRLQEYQERYDALSLEKSENISFEQLKDLSDRTTAAKNDRIKLESDIEQVKRTDPENFAGLLQIASVQAIPQVAELQSQINAAKAELRQLLSASLSAYKSPQLRPKYIVAQASLQQLQDSLNGTLRHAREFLAERYKTAKETEDKLAAAFHEQQQAALDMNRIGIPYNVLKREVDSERSMYDSLMMRIRETTISTEIKSSPFHVIQEPMASIAPVKPEKMKMMLAALVFGLVVSGVVLVVLDSLDDTLRSVDQAEEFLGLSVLAAIPEEKLRKRARLPFVVVETPESPQAEAFRFVRAKLSLPKPESSGRVLLMTSAVSDEGKSFSAINIGAAFAIDGLRTVVVEADLRRPSFFRALPGMADKKTPGLGDYLAGQEPMESIIRQSPLDNLSFIFAGRSAHNPAELLASRSLNTLVDCLREGFDLVIFDSPPINAVSDTLTLIRVVQYVCLVVRPGKTRKKAIARACAMVEKAGGKIAGFFFNRVNLKFGAADLYYYYGRSFGKQKLRRLSGNMVRWGAVGSFIVLAAGAAQWWVLDSGRKKAGASPASSQFGLLEPQLKQVEGRVQSAEKRADPATNERTTLATNLKKAVEKVQTAQKTGDEAMSQREGLQDQLRDTEARAQQVQKDAAPSVSQRDELQTQLKDSEAKRQLAQKNAKDAASQRDALQTQLKETETKAQLLRKDAAVAASQRSAMEAELTKAQDAAQTAQKTADEAVSQRSALEADLRKAQEVVKEAQKSGDFAASQREGLQNQLRDAEAKAQEAQQNVALVTSQRDALQSQLKELAQSKGEPPSVQGDALQRKASDAEARDQQIQKNLELVTGQRDALQKQLGDTGLNVQQAHKDAALAISQRDVLRDQLKGTEVKAQQLQKSLELATSQRDGLQSQLKDTEAKSRQAQKNAEVAASQRDALQTQLKETEAKAQLAQKGAAVAASQRSAMEAELTKAQDTVQTAQKNADLAISQRSALEADLKKALEKAQTAQKTADEAISQRSVLEADLTKAQEAVKEAQKSGDLASTQRSALEARLKQTQDKLQQAEQRADLATAERSAIEAQVKKAEEKAQLARNMGDLVVAAGRPEEDGSSKGESAKNNTESANQLRSGRAMPLDADQEKPGVGTTTVIPSVQSAKQ